MVNVEAVISVQHWWKSRRFWSSTTHNPSCPKVQKPTSPWFGRTLRLPLVCDAHYCLLRTRELPKRSTLRCVVIFSMNSIYIFTIIWCPYVPLCSSCFFHLSGHSQSRLCILLCCTDCTMIPLSLSWTFSPTVMPLFFHRFVLTLSWSFVLLFSL